MNYIRIQKVTASTTREALNNHYLVVEQYKQYDPGKLIYLLYLIKKFNKIIVGEHKSTPSNISEVIK